jgi:hypothetical protein
LGKNFIVVTDAAMSGPTFGLRPVTTIALSVATRHMSPYASEDCDDDEEYFVMMACCGTWDGLWLTSFLAKHRL